MDLVIQHGELVDNFFESLMLRLVNAWEQLHIFILTETGSKSFFLSSK